MWKTSLIKHEKVGWNRYFIKKLSTQKQSAYKSVKSYVFVWIKLVKKFLNFSLLTRTRLNCYWFILPLQSLHFHLILVLPLQSLPVLLLQLLLFLLRLLRLLHILPRLGLLPLLLLLLQQ